LLACFKGIGAKLVIILLHLLEKAPEQDMLILTNLFSHQILLKMINTSSVASIICIAPSATHYAAEWIHLDAVYILYGPM
jgi:hypothetical protein